MIGLGVKVSVLSLDAGPTCWIYDCAQTGNAPTADSNSATVSLFISFSPGIAASAHLGRIEPQRNLFPSRLIAPASFERERATQRHPPGHRVQGTERELCMPHLCPSGLWSIVSIAADKIWRNMKNRLNIRPEMHGKITCLENLACNPAMAALAALAPGW